MRPNDVGQSVENHDHGSLAAFLIDVGANQMIGRSSDPGNIGLERALRAFNHVPVPQGIGNLPSANGGTSLSFDRL